MRPRFTTDDPRIQHIPEVGCWIWTGYTNQGYGQVGINRTTRRVHRLMWEATRGAVPYGMVLDHICRERSCCNPDHLRVVTVGENSTRNSAGPTARNASKAHCPKCGGAYHTRPNGYRMCKTCKAAWRKVYADRDRKARRLRAAMLDAARTGEAR